MRLLIYTLKAIVLATAVSAAPQLVVNAPKDGTLNLRTGPSTHYHIIRAMPHGSRVTQIDSRGAWRQVRDQRGSVGWAHGAYLKTTAAPISEFVRKNPEIGKPRYVQAPDGALNLRTGPKTSYKVVQKLRNGQRVEVIGEIGAWNLVQLNSGVVGWAHGRYLVQNKPRPAPKPVPVITPDVAPQMPFLVRIVRACRDAYGKELRQCIRRELRRGYN